MSEMNVLTSMLGIFFSLSEEPARGRKRYFCINLEKGKRKIIHLPISTLLLISDLSLSLSLPLSSSHSQTHNSSLSLSLSVTHARTASPSLFLFLSLTRTLHLSLMQTPHLSLSHSLAHYFSLILLTRTWQTDRRRHAGLWLSCRKTGEGGFSLKLVL